MLDRSPRFGLTIQLAGVLCHARVAVVEVCGVSEIRAGGERGSAAVLIYLTGGKCPRLPFCGCRGSSSSRWRPAPLASLSI